MGPQRQPPQLHYHIRWLRVVALDWECFNTFAEAEARARELVRRDETYIIEERDETCHVAMYLKTAHDAAAEPVSTLKYRWQQAVLDAFTEVRSEYLAVKINAAQRAIAERLRDHTPADLDEELAIRDALQSLRVLLPERSEPKDESGEKKAIA